MPVEGFYTEPSKQELADYARYIVKLAGLKARTIYSVCEGMQGGYMPISVSYFATKTDARDYMKECARNARNDDYKVTGSAMAGYYTINDPEKSDYAMDEYIEMNEVRLGDLGLSSSELTDPLGDILERLNNA